LWKLRGDRRRRASAHGNGGDDRAELARERDRDEFDDVARRTVSAPPPPGAPPRARQKDISATTGGALTPIAIISSPVPPAAFPTIRERGRQPQQRSPQLSVSVPTFVAGEIAARPVAASIT
jgi:hypothetical protein